MAKMHAGLDSNDWQTACRGLKDRLGNLLTQGLWTDCVLVVGTAQVKMPAHRLLLGSASPVLAVMLYGPLTQPDNNTFSIPNIEPDIFNKVLEFIYTDAINLDSCEVAHSLFEAAHYLNLPEVERTCVKYLMDEVSTETVLPVYEFAVMFNEEVLKNKCLEMMGGDFSCDILTGAGICAARADTLAYLFSREDLRCRTELELFAAAERWVRTQTDSWRPNEVISESTASSASSSKSPSIISGEAFSDSGNNEESDAGDVKLLKKEPNGSQSPPSFGEDPKAMIRPALRHIRFLTIDPAEFAQHDMTTLLTDKEILAISLNLANPKTYMEIPKGFSTSREERCVKKSFWAHFKIDEICLNDKILSPELVFPDDVSWRLCLRRNRYDVEGGCLDLSMFCEADHYYDGFVCDARVKLTLLSNDKNFQMTWIKNYKFMRKIDFERNVVDIGPEVVWNDLMNPEKGYIKIIGKKQYITFKIETSFVSLKYESR